MIGSDFKDAKRILPGPLRTVVATIFQKIGLPEQDAALIADCLVQVDLRGVFSHGIAWVPKYVDYYSRGVVNPRPKVRIVRETPVATVVDGDGGLGYLAATLATQSAVEKALKQGIAIGIGRHHGHVGSAGIYARMALDKALISFCLSGTGSWRRPPSTDAALWDAMKSPPMCFGIPAAEGPPLVLDMNVNFFNNREAAFEAFEVYPGVVLKSLGLMFVSTLLAGVWAGQVPAQERKPEFGHSIRGFTIVAIRPDLVGDADAFKAEVSRIIRESRSLRPFPGTPSAEVAGSLEWQREREWTVQGIPMPEEQRKALEKLAGELHVDIPW